MKTILIDDLIALLNLMKEKNGVRRVDMNKLTRDIDLADLATISRVGDKLDKLIFHRKFFYIVDHLISSISFPTPEIPVLGETKVYELGREISSRMVSRIMRKDGFRGSTMGEGVVWARRHPNYRGPIVLLGQVAKIGGKRYVGALCNDSSRRQLYLNRVISYWPADRRFLAVREQ